MRCSSCSTRTAPRRRRA
ncbi:hypothetical protein [Luteibacter sp. RCC_6_2]